MVPSIKLTYFNIEGAGEPVRLALELAGIEYEDERIGFPEWKDLKPKTPFGQLPLMTIDGGSPRAQSMAMLRYVASKSDALYPNDSLFDIEEALGVVEDMKGSWGPNLYVGMRPENYGYPEDFSKTEQGKELVKKMRETWVKEKLPHHLDILVGLLKKQDNQFLASKSAPTIVDCVAIPLLRSFTKGHIDHVPTSCLESHPDIVDYVKRFCALPAIKDRYDNGLH